MKWGPSGDRGTSDEDEVGTVRAGALVSGADPLPAAVAGRRDDILEPGLLTHLTVACATISKLLSDCFALARNTNLVTSVELSSVLVEQAGLHGLVHFEHNTVLVLLFRLDE